jgi:hypothetical protein
MGVLDEPWSAGAPLDLRLPPGVGDRLRPSPQPLDQVRARCATEEVLGRPGLAHALDLLWKERFWERRR